MITLLRKLFIKDYQNVSDKKVREKHGLLASIGGIIINALLFSFKLLIGIISSSMSIISDAINNLTDFLSCFVNLFGFKMSSKPADKEHPFGHQRIEYIAGLIVCIIIVIIGVILGYTSIMNLINQKSNLDLSIYAFIILGGSILFKILLALYNYKIGKIINSVALKASFIDSINDVVSTSVVLIASLIQYFYPSLWYLDSSMSLIVSVYILISGIKMLKDNEFDDRTMIIVSLSFCIGVGLTQTSGNFFAAFPSVVGDIFNGNAVAGVFVVSLLLSLFLPKEKKEKQENKKA